MYCTIQSVNFSSTDQTDVGMQQNQAFSVLNLGPLEL